MRNAYYISATVILLCALALGCLVSVSIPYLSFFDIVHVTLSTTSSATTPLVQSKLGIWGYCNYLRTSNGTTRTCNRTGPVYYVTYTLDGIKTASVSANWTRGLVLHPVAAAFTLFAFVLSNFHAPFCAALSLPLALLAAIFTLVVFIIDIALFAHLKAQIDKFELSASTTPGAAFWVTLITFVLLLLAGCAIFLGQRKAQARAGRFSTSGHRRSGSGQPSGQR